MKRMFSARALTLIPAFALLTIVGCVDPLSHNCDEPNHQHDSLGNPGEPPPAGSMVMRYTGARSGIFTVDPHAQLDDGCRQVGRSWSMKSPDEETVIGKDTLLFGIHVVESELVHDHFDGTQDQFTVRLVKSAYVPRNESAQLKAGDQFTFGATSTEAARSEFSIEADLFLGINGGHFPEVLRQYDPRVFSTFAGSDPLTLTITSVDCNRSVNTYMGVQRMDYIRGTIRGSLRNSAGDIVTIQSAPISINAVRTN